MAFWRKVAEPLDSRLATLEGRVAALEGAAGEMRSIAVEWEQVYDKFNHLLKRWNKRARDEARVASGAPNEPGPAPPINPMALRLLQRGGEG